MLSITKSNFDINNDNHSMVEKGRGGEWWGGILLNWKPWAESIALVFLINKIDSLDSEFIKTEKNKIRETNTQNWLQ